MDKTEFGYFYLNAVAIDDSVAFDSAIEIDVRGLAISWDITSGKSVMKAYIA